MINLIQTVEQLVDVLEDSDPLEHAQIMRTIQISAQELAPYATWSSASYTRNCLARTEDYEIILLCWDMNAKTPIHGHGGENCWVYQVQGTVEEVRLEENAGIPEETCRIVLSPGKLTYMNDRMGYHTIENTSAGPAMTLHIYASPIDSCKVYNDQKDCFEIKEMYYDTIVENEVESCIA